MKYQKLYTYLLSLLTVLGGILCYLLVANFINSSSVLSASVAGLFGSFILLKRIKLQQLFYMGCFIAMSSPLFLHRYILSLFVIVISTTCFFFCKNILKGYGGGLGALAFIGCLAGYIWII